MIKQHLSSSFSVSRVKVLGEEETFSPDKIAAGQLPRERFSMEIDSVITSKELLTSIEKEYDRKGFSWKYLDNNKEDDGSIQVSLEVQSNVACYRVTMSLNGKFFSFSSLPL